MNFILVCPLYDSPRVTLQNAMGHIAPFTLRTLFYGDDNLDFTEKLEVLRERRPLWPRQIITLILPTVKMLSLGCERLPTPLKKKKKKKKVLDHYLHHDLGMLPLLRCFLLIYSSYNTQITTKI